MKVVESVCIDKTSMSQEIAHLAEMTEMFELQDSTHFSQATFSGDVMLCRA